MSRSDDVDVSDDSERCFGDSMVCDAGRFAKRKEPNDGSKTAFPAVSRFLSSLNVCNSARPNLGVEHAVAWGVASLISHADTRNKILAQFGHELFYEYLYEMLLFDHSTEQDDVADVLCSAGKGVMQNLQNGIFPKPHPFSAQTVASGNSRKSPRSSTAYGAALTDVVLNASVIDVEEKRSPLAGRRASFTSSAFSSGGSEPAISSGGESTPIANSVSNASLHVSSPAIAASLKDEDHDSNHLIKEQIPRCANINVVASAVWSCASTLYAVDDVKVCNVCMAMCVAIYSNFLCSFPLHFRVWSKDFARSH